jgi:hypothetical protein
MEIEYKGFEKERGEDEEEKDGEYECNEKCSGGKFCLRRCYGVPIYTIQH